MKRARLLLKASRTMIGESNHIALMIFTGLVWGLLVLAILATTFALITYKKDTDSLIYMDRIVIQFNAMIIAYGIARSSYTGFIEVKKESGRSSFNRFAIQLPVSKEDVIKAQFLDLVRCAFPGFLIVSYTTILGLIVGVDKIMMRYMGILILFFIIVFLVISFEKGIFTYLFIDDKIRQCVYMVFVLVALGVGMMSKNLEQKVHGFLSLSKPLESSSVSYYVNSGLEFLGGLGGLISLCIAGIIGYYLSCYLPIKISKLREGRE